MVIRPGALCQPNPRDGVTAVAAGLVAVDSDMGFMEVPRAPQAACSTPATRLPKGRAMTGDNHVEN